MRFDRESGEDKAVAALLRTTAGQILMREIVAEVMNLPAFGADIGAVNEMNGRRRLAAEFITLLADANDDRSAIPDHPVDAGTAVAVARAVRARNVPVSGPGQSRRQRRFARPGEPGAGG